MTKHVIGVTTMIALILALAHSTWPQRLILEMTSVVFGDSLLDAVEKVGVVNAVTDRQIGTDAEKFCHQMRELGRGDTDACRAVFAAIAK
ncbi:MAG: hypothetical protein ACR2QC_04345 [Gammaproteobacteria bacterium]